MNERRRFLTYAAGVGAALSATRATAETEPPRHSEEFLLSERTRELLALFGISYPILQAPVGFSSGPDLVIAVNKAGGLGSMALTRASPDEAKDRVRKVLSATKVPFVVNYILGFEPKSLSAALDAGAAYVVCQGIEAGGHVQGTAPLMEVLPSVLGVANGRPVFAAGGIGNGRGIRKYLKLAPQAPCWELDL